MKIAMWSGPRALSTAMMYAFGNRPDMTVLDEPFYAAYLHLSGADHPMRQACLTSQETEPDAVVERLGVTPETPHLYAKMMVHHMVDGMPIKWAGAFTNVHLIRHPARVIASYGKKHASVTMDDIGFAEVARLYAALPGPVIDSNDIRKNPEAVLRKLCGEIGLGFDKTMLSWPIGPKPFDGVWARHWYDAVHRSTGFAAAEGPLPDVAPKDRALLSACLPIYEDMFARRITL